MGRSRQHNIAFLARGPDSISTGPTFAVGETQDVTYFFASLHTDGDFEVLPLVATGANGQPAFADCLDSSQDQEPLLSRMWSPRLLDSDIVVVSGERTGVHSDRVCVPEWHTP